jgi:protocatechuate 3,4-dioxygenase beta subunit
MREARTRRFSDQTHFPTVAPSVWVPDEDAELARDREGASMDWKDEFYQRDRSLHPPAFTPDYKTSVLRSPRRALLSLQSSLSEVTGPLFGEDGLDPRDNDLITNFSEGGEAIGQRIIIHGRVLDENGRPVPRALIEVWQANAGGRYRHLSDRYVAALDPNFGGCGRCLSDADGAYFFRTVRPGAYPWRNGANDWRPAHIHFSIFGPAFITRLITQMYFEGDPLIARCPIVNTIPDKDAIDRLIARLDINASVPLDTLAYRFDIVLRGRRQTLFENRLEGL